MSRSTSAYIYIYIWVELESVVYSYYLVQNNSLLRKLIIVKKHEVSRAWCAEPHVALLGEGTFGPRQILGTTELFNRFESHFRLFDDLHSQWNLEHA